MTKMISCDRCGEIDSGIELLGCGIERFYTAKVKMYQYADVPEFIAVDLCNVCLGKLRAIVTEFMENE